MDLDLAGISGHGIQERLWELVQCVQWGLGGSQDWYRLPSHPCSWLSHVFWASVWFGSSVCIPRCSRHQQCCAWVWLLGSGRLRGQLWASWMAAVFWKTNRILPRECTGHSKQPLPTTQEMTLHMDITSQYQNQIDYILCSQRWGKTIQSAKQDLELNVARVLPRLDPGYWKCDSVSIEKDKERMLQIR